MRRSSARRRATSSVARERLGQIVVRAGLQPGDALRHLGTGREHQHGRAIADGAHPPADLQAVETGHQHVEDDRVGRVDSERADRLASVDCRRHLEPTQVEQERERLAHGRLIVYDEQTHGPMLTGQLKES